jgi:hypothetical protein
MRDGIHMPSVTVEELIARLDEVQYLAELIQQEQQGELTPLQVEIRQRLHELKQALRDHIHANRLPPT